MNARSSDVPAPDPNFQRNRESPVDNSREVDAGGEAQAPFARDHVLLQGRSLRVNGRHRGDIDSRREGRAQADGQIVDVDDGVGRQIEVEVLGHRFSTRRERQTEVHLRPRREAFRIRHRQLDAPAGPFPHAGQVAVTGPAHLAELLEADTDPHHSRPPTGSSVTGTSPPALRSWPVPWLPPAGGSVDATTCSMP